MKKTMTEQLYRRRAGEPVQVWRVGDGEPPEWTEHAIRQFLRAFPGVKPRDWASAMEGSVVFRREDGRLETLAAEAFERDYEPLPTPAPDARNCTCNLRTRLVGDGCDVCNPDLAGTVAPAPDAREALDEATLTVIYEALRFADWAAGEGICPDIEGRPESAEFLSDFIDAKGLTELDYADLPEYVRQALARIGGGA